MSPELDTLDQLQGGFMLLIVVRKIFPDHAHFTRGLQGLLTGGDVRLVGIDGFEIPTWQWPEVIATPERWPMVQVGLTPAGARRIG